MSIRLVNKVYEIDVNGTEQSTLIALAFMADERGTCWPSVMTISLRIKKDVRTVQRAIAGLVKKGLLSREASYRANGSQKSSVYKVLPEYFENEGSAHLAAQSFIPPMTPLSPPGDKGVTPLTVTESKDINSYNDHSVVISYPDFLSDSERFQASKILEKLSVAEAQQLLDELDDRHKQGGVRSPIPYLVGLEKKHAVGQFVRKDNVRTEDQVRQVFTRAEIREKPSEANLIEASKHINCIKDILRNGGKNYE